MCRLLLASLLACSMGCAARAPLAYSFQLGVAEPEAKAKLAAIAPRLDALLLDAFKAAKATAMVKASCSTASSCTRARSGWQTRRGRSPSTSIRCFAWRR